MAGVAYSHGVHSSEEHGRAKNLGHGVLVVSHASSSCYQTRVRWMARMGGHFGHRALQGKYNERGIIVGGKIVHELRRSFQDVQFATICNKIKLILPTSRV